MIGLKRRTTWMMAVLAPLLLLAGGFAPTVPHGPRVDAVPAARIAQAGIVLAGHTVDGLPIFAPAKTVPVVAGSTIYGCYDQQYCLYATRGWTNETYHAYIEYILSRSGGINLYGGDDNTANGAVNNTGHSIINCQYHAGGGFCWVVAAYTRWDWTDLWRRDRDSWIRYSG